MNEDYYRNPVFMFPAEIGELAPDIMLVHRNGRFVERLKSGNE